MAGPMAGVRVVELGVWVAGPAAGVFNPGANNLVYARTDNGGAYRWNEAGPSWTPLLDGVGHFDRFAVAGSCGMRRYL